MISQYYRRELERLRQLGAEFARAHPAFAPMLSAEGTDPDVERLLEGVAFLTGLVHEKLDDELPEVLYTMLQSIAPHYLRPIPAMTMIAFSPKRALREGIVIARGTTINSIPVDDTVCPFSICRDVVLVPMRISAAVFQEEGKRAGVLRITFVLTDMLLSALPDNSIHLSLMGDHANAAKLFMALEQGLREIRLVPAAEDGESVRLPREHFIPGGLDAGEALLTYPPAAFGGFRHLQEYFILPERFCAFSISGLDRWRNRGAGDTFTLELALADLPDALPSVDVNSFRLFVTPAVNLSSCSSEPIALDHRRPAYLVSPSGRNSERYWTHSVEGVHSIVQGTSERREYHHFLSANPSSEVGLAYSVSPRLSPLSGNVEQWISVSHPPKTSLVPEVLLVDITCSNGNLPERLKTGDINQPSSTSPELADFANLSPPTAAVQPPMGSGVLWRLLSHQFLNLFSIANAENLRSILRLYVFGDTHDRAGVLANLKRVESILDVQVEQGRHFVQDHMMRGQHIRIVLQHEGFAGEGDMYLFGSVLNRFLSGYAALNTYTRLQVSDDLNRRLYQWTARLGSRPLL
ncbi:MAG: type VI secretion system baseplate subunit TssF [Burkholderiaceae bacterium]|nr:type VI secretion system baseplate subunit TssF [Burkholderiaceae bacterium]